MPPAPHLQLEAATVRYGALTALDAVDLDLPPGSRVAILGENGAGKSTLAHVLCGARTPDSGTLRIDGAPVRLRSPRDAARRGIGIVPQHDRLVPALTVAENVALGREPRRAGLFLDRRAAAHQVAAAADTLGFALDPDARVGDLPVGARQRAAIVDALCRGARLLVLDEPGATLSPSETRDLWRVVDRLADSGTTLLFVTHRLPEAIAHARHIVVLRRGRVALRVASDQADPALLAAAVVGDGAAPSPAPPADAPTPGPERCVFAWKGHRVAVRAGEIVGLAGVDGSGAGACVDALIGVAPPPDGLLLDGQDAAGWSVARRRAWGLAHVPEDRRRDALAGSLALEENVVLGRHRDPPFARGPRIAPGARRRALDDAVARFDIRGARPGLPADALSGGNQQKLVLARALADRPKVLVAAQPTRGLDFAATAQVHDALRAAAGDGAAVVLASADLDELRALCTRLVVFHDGRIAGTLERAEADDARLGALMTGSGS